MRANSEDERLRRRGRVALVPLSVLALAAIGAALLYTFRARPAPRWEGPPNASDPDQAIEVLAGTVEIGAGSDLAARLAPLHVDGDRQRFDADALRRKLSLGEGEPWRLELRLVAAEAGGATPSVTLERIEVLDARGTALAALGSLAGAPGDANALDPLRTLTAPPSEPLSAGRAIDVVLWGRAPDGPARAVGMRWVETARASFPVAVEIELRPQPARRSELHAPMARLDREAIRSGGNTPAPSPSGAAAESRRNDDAERQH